MMMSVSKLLSFAALFFFVLFSFIKLSWCTGNSTITCPEIEKQSLLSFKQSVHVLENNLSSWSDEVNCCNWEGILCSNRTGHVERLRLQAGHSGGQISPSLLNLKYLKYLNLSSNEYGSPLRVDSLEWLSGLSKLEYLIIIGVNLGRASHWQQQVMNKLPSLVGLVLINCNLNNTDPLGEVNIATSNLTILDLSNCYSYSIGEDGYIYSGIIVPRWIFHLSNLTYLDLSGNNYEGPIPSVSNTTKLQYIDLSGNMFNSSIPEWLYTLKDLEFLDMSQNNLQGPISNSISNLTSLVTLDLHYNQLSGKLPRGISTLCKLQYLELGGNKFEGEMSYSFGNMSDCFFGALESLDLSDHYISSASIVPRWIFHLSNLTYLDLSGNDYEGPIPSVSNTTKLRHLDLSSNRFDSSILEWLYTLKDLEFLDLSQNNLQGPISNSISNLTSRNDLGSYGNVLSGKLPRGTTNLCKLQHLDLSDNKLEGEISDLFGNMSDRFLGALEDLKNLQHLNLSRNSLSGVIPSNLGNLSSLRSLLLNDNKLTGNLPETIGQISNLDFLHIENNMLEGIVTETHFANLSRLLWLVASGNQLTLKVRPNWIPPFEIYVLALGSWNLGSRFPSWLDTQKMTIHDLVLSNTGIYDNVPNWVWNVEFLDLSHNQLYGQLPRISTTSTEELDLSNNLFSGDLSQFLCNTTTNYALYNLNLGGNHFTGELQNCFIKWPSLFALNISNNKLSGRIPDSIGFLTRLQFLNLYGNNLFGNIPSSMQNCKELMTMDLSDNNLSGNLPKPIMTSLSKLVIFIVKSNKLSGEITSAICQLSSLQIIDLSDNMFSGKIPRCLDNFTAMITKRSLVTYSYTVSTLRNLVGHRFTITATFKESASIATKGTELTYNTILPLVTSIDLSRNNLSGDIPEQITSLVELRTLNLSGNRLTGMIPDTIGNMKNLESLDFSMNSLSGELPNSFTAMSYLDYLNVSYNKLRGRIPECTQLRGFKESSFVGNNLCGPPLARCEAPGTVHPEEEGSGKPEIEWLYVFTSLGCAVGLSATLTTLFLKRSWREAYFEFIQNILDNAYVYALVKWRKLKSGLGLKM